MKALVGLLVFLAACGGEDAAAPSTPAPSSPEKIVVEEVANLTSIDLQDPGVQVASILVGQVPCVVVGERGPSRGDSGSPNLSVSVTCGWGTR
jgi:hypothetical protein